MRKVVFIARPAHLGSIGQIGIYLGITDNQLAFNFALTQARGNDFAAYFLAEFFEVHAFRFEFGAEFRQRWEIVLLGNSRHGQIKLRIVHAHTVFSGILRLQHVHDHALKHLFFQYFRRRQGCALLLQLAHRSMQAVVQFQARDHIIVDQRNDRINFCNLFLRIGWRKAGSR